MTWPATKALDAARRALTADALVRAAWNPPLAALLRACSVQPAVKVGQATLVNDPCLIREVLLGASFQRDGARTTGGQVSRLFGAPALFNDVGPGHRATRSLLIARMHEVVDLRPWADAVSSAQAVWSVGGTVDVVRLAESMAGAAAAALLETAGRDPASFARDVARVNAYAVRGSIPACPRPRFPSAEARRLKEAIDGCGLLRRCVDAGAAREDARALGAVTALATVATTVSALPRVVALALADPGASPADLMARAAPTVAMPRRLAEDFAYGPLRLRAGGLVVLNVSSPAAVALDGSMSLAFGLGPHSCPGSSAALAMAADLRSAVLACGGRVVRSRPSFTSAFPAWAVLDVRGGKPTPQCLGHVKD